VTSETGRNAACDSGQAWPRREEQPAEKTTDGSERAVVHATKESLKNAPALQRQARAQ
jgi:hypothetical protein